MPAMYDLRTSGCWQYLSVHMFLTRSWSKRKKYLLKKTHTLSTSPSLLHLPGQPSSRYRQASCERSAWRSGGRGLGENSWISSTGLVKGVNGDLTGAVKHGLLSRKSSSVRVEDSSRSVGGDNKLSGWTTMQQDTEDKTPSSSKVFSSSVVS